MDLKEMYFLFKIRNLLYNVYKLVFYQFLFIYYIVNRNNYKKINYKN